MESPLEELVARAAAGPAEARRAAFGELVRRYQDAAYAYAYALTGDREAAQDAAQEAFLAAYRSLGQLREAAAFPGWLRRIVRTYCLRAARSAVETVPLSAVESVPGDGVATGDGADAGFARRRRGARPARREGDAGDGRPPGAGAGVGAARWGVGGAAAEGDPAAAAEAGELREALARLIRALPAREREAVVLYYVADRPQEEIAAFLGVPTNTVKKRLQAARARLHGRMDEMARRTLREHAPSRSGAFADAVQFLAGLDAAAAEGELRLVELMAIDGVDLDAPDRNGRTLLGWAAERGRLEAAQTLIEAGARVNAKDGDGRTALARAIDAGQVQVAALLRRHGGRL